MAKFRDNLENENLSFSLIVNCDTQQELTFRMADRSVRMQEQDCIDLARKLLNAASSMGEQESPQLTPKTAVIIELEEQALMFREMAAAHEGREASVILDCADLLLKHASAIETDECKLAALCEPKFQDKKVSND